MCGDEVLVWFGEIGEVKFVCCFGVLFVFWFCYFVIGINFCVNYFFFLWIVG